ncbi:hypothetical protein FGB62_13g249 [Gracilaria domingensis]|nr:hypothetical protein FGB62_13g249 [Gracilaria domingensis]
MLPIHCHEPLQCEILDLESSAAARREHDLYYCAVAVRKRDQLDDPFHERDFLCVASHFSVETARIAALEQAIDITNAIRTPCIPAEYIDAKPMQLQMRTSVFGEDVPKMEVHFSSDGRWRYDADYHHLAALLERIGAPGVTAFHNLDAQDIQQRIQALRRDSSRQEDGWDINDSRYDAFLGIHKSAPLSGCRPQGEPAICPSTVSRCMSVGSDIVLNSALARRHKAPFRGIEDADRIVKQVTESADELAALSVHQRNARVKAYNVLGNNATKLWSVQSSMKDASQERVEVVTESEQKGGMSRAMQRALLGDRGLADVDDLRVNGAYVAIGMCVDSVGCSSAMAWLSGAEQIAGKT